MNAFQRVSAIAVMAIVGGAFWCCEAAATPVTITVQRYLDAAFTTLAPNGSTTLDSGFFATAEISLDSTLIGNYPDAAFIGLKVDPFLGTNVEWSVNANSLVAQGELLTVAAASVPAGVTDYYLRVIVDADTYTAPGNPGTNVVASTVYADSGMADAQASLSSKIDGSSIGGNYSILSGITGTSAPISENHIRAGSYALRHAYDITLFGNSTPTQSNISVTTTVTVPEPSSALLVSIAALFAGISFRAHVAVCSGRAQALR